MTRAGTIGPSVSPLPVWVPEAARRYLAHTVRGDSIRALARTSACAPSTVLRQVRRFENMRDDFLIDEALQYLGHMLHPPFARDRNKNGDDMSFYDRQEKTAPDDETLDREARRVLRRLSEPGAVLAVAVEMDKAVVVRDGEGGQTTRTAVVDRAVAQALALKDWIACAEPGRIARYRITSAGRAAVSRMLAEAENAASGFGEAQLPFQLQNDGAKETAFGTGSCTRRKLRVNLAESPMTALARRKDRNGQPFLSSDLVAAGERLREDFELAQMGPRNAQNWERFLTGPVDERCRSGDALGGSQGARDRVANALRDLGPGLGDVALWCCCFLEGLEMTEKRMGWSARSGKIVLRIALQRLRQHYAQLGSAANMIG